MIPWGTHPGGLNCSRGFFPTVPGGAPAGHSEEGSPEALTQEVDTRRQVCGPTAFPRHRGAFLPPHLTCHLRGPCHFLLLEQPSTCPEPKAQQRCSTPRVGPQWRAPSEAPPGFSIVLISRCIRLHNKTVDPQLTDTRGDW